MKIKNVEINNFRKLRKKVSIDMNKQLLIVGKNNTGKTSVFEVFEKFLIVGKKFRFEDFSSSVISKEVFNDAYIEYIRLLSENHNQKIDKSKIKELENKFPKITLDVMICIEDEDNLSEIKDLLYEFDNNGTLLLKCSYEFNNLEQAIKNFEDYNKRIEEKNRKNDSKNIKEIDFYHYIKREFSTYYLINFYSTKENSDYIHDVDPNFARGLFNIGIITAQREVDDTSEQSKQNISNAIWNFYEKMLRDNESLNQEDTFDNSISGIKENLNENYKIIFNELISEVNRNVLNNEEHQNVQIVSDFNIEEILKRNSKLKYSIDELVLPESYNGLGYSNMLYIFIQIITYKYKVNKDKKIFNILFIEEPESHLHPQMQSTFLSKIDDILGKDNNVYKVITTHSSYILQKADLLSVRYFLYTENNIVSRSLYEFFEKPEFANLKTFIQKYFKINTCDLFFSDKAILVEGTVERMLMPLLIEKFDNLSEENNLSKQHITTIEVGGAYAHIFNELLDFLEIRTVIITDIDSVSGSHNSKCKCYLEEVAIGDERLTVKTSNAIIKDWFNKIGESFYIRKLVEESFTKDILIKKVNEKEVRKITFQLPMTGQKIWGRTFEEQLIIENNSYFEEILKDEEKSKSIQSLMNAISKTNTNGINCLELKDISGDILENCAFEIVDNIDKTNFALDLLTLENWQIPQYIKEGFEWLQK